MDQFKRHVAYKVGISHITNAEYAKGEDQWAPSYLAINGMKVSRVNLIGIIVGIEEGSIIIDDGTARITLRIFDSAFEFDATVGDAVIVIGRPREFNNERYIVPEIIKKVDKSWLQVRKLEVNSIVVQEKSQEKATEVEAVEEDPATKVYGLIKSLDKGDGVEVESLLAASKVDSGEKIISNLLKEGEIFEVRPGRVKVLE